MQCERQTTIEMFEERTIDSLLDQHWTVPQRVRLLLQVSEGTVDLI